MRGIAATLINDDCSGVYIDTDLHISVADTLTMLIREQVSHDHTGDQTDRIAEYISELRQCLNEDSALAATTLEAILSLPATTGLDAQRDTLLRSNAFHAAAIAADLGHLKSGLLAYLDQYGLEPDRPETNIHDLGSTEYLCPRPGVTRH